MAIVPRKTDSDFSPTWKWTDDEELGGAHVEFRKAAVDGGDKIVWEIDAEKHGPVSVWLDFAVLVEKVRSELGRRKITNGSPVLEPRERVRINPGKKRPSKRNPGQTVWPFPVVEFEHGVPEQSAEEFLLAGSAVDKPDDELLEDAVVAEQPRFPEFDDTKAGADDNPPF
jgi:hypothetical protein